MFQGPIILDRSASATRRVGRRPVATDRPERLAMSTLRTAGLAPAMVWLCGLGIVCMLALIWVLSARVAPMPLLFWGGAVLLANGATIRMRTRGASVPAGAAGRSWPLALAETCIHAALWASVGWVVGTGHGAQIDLILGIALGTMMMGAILLAIVPVAALLWIGILGSSLGHVLYDARTALPAGLLLMLGLALAAILIGCRRIESLLSSHLAVATQERRAREEIGLLLKEYEDQGIGWLWQIDAANLLTYVSPRLCVLIGRSTNQLIGQSLPVLLGCDPGLGASLVAHVPFHNLDVDIVTPSGPRCIALSGSPVIDVAGAFHGFRGVGTDVTEVRRSQDHLTQLASIDVLTGLPNRQRLRDIMAKGVEHSRSTGVPCAILFLDLDGFKPVNDTFGHPVGDAVLRNVAQRLQAEVAALGIIGRVGGDEFALMLHDGGSRAGVKALAHRLVAAVAEPFLFDKGEIRIGISVGCAFSPMDGTAIDDLLLKADLALYQAKSQGRGTVRLFDTVMQRQAEARLKLEQDLRKALERGQLRIAYQPIVSAQTQDVLGFEALLRWQHPELGLVSPADFIPLAEETGLIAPIGRWVAEQACRDCAAWPGRLFVSVNVSPRQLLDPGLPHVIAEALAHARLQPNRLELEVTESVFMGDSDGSLDVLRRLRTLGLGIALDDFGTGYSSLGYLNKTIFHTLKIDGSFVRDAATKPETNAIIGAIVSLANSFRMQITAEGVETVEDVQRMQAFGCHKLQGYLFGKPMWQEDALALVGDRYTPLAATG